MAAANDATVVTCTNNSDYAVICSFFEHFGDKSGILFPSFQDLQQMLENAEEVAYPLVELHVKLMRKLKKSVLFDRWEKAAAKYAHSYSDQDGWEIERFGYKKVSLEVKLRLLKNLLEAQFDGNIKFKNEINKVTSDELRMQPLGKDVHGRRYWHLLDDDCNLRVFREDLDEETWELVSSDRESMMKLIEQLTTGKDIPEEEEGTSPATSDENNTNGQEESKSDCNQESEVTKIDDGPSDNKKLKLESSEAEETTNSHQEAVVSEAIESPVLLVKGEGNGADCEAGNPGEGKNEEPCESFESKNEEEKVDDRETDRTKSCVAPSESVPNSENKVGPCESLHQSEQVVQTAETPPFRTNSDTSVESSSATETPTLGSSSDARTIEGDDTTAIASPQVADPPLVVAAAISDSDVKEKVVTEEAGQSETSPPISSTEENTSKQISIEQSSTKVDDNPKSEVDPQLETKSEEVPSEVVSKPLLVSCESIETPVAHNQELPESEISTCCSTSVGVETNNSPSEEAVVSLTESTKNPTSEIDDATSSRNINEVESQEAKSESVSNTEVDSSAHVIESLETKESHSEQMAKDAISDACELQESSKVECQEVALTTPLESPAQTKVIDSSIQEAISQSVLNDESTGSGCLNEVTKECTLEKESLNDASVGDCASPTNQTAVPADETIAATPVTENQVKTEEMDASTESQSCQLNAEVESPHVETTDAPLLESGNPLNDASNTEEKASSVTSTDVSVPHLNPPADDRSSASPELAIDTESSVESTNLLISSASNEEDVVDASLPVESSSATFPAITKIEDNVEGSKSIEISETESNPIVKDHQDTTSTPLETKVVDEKTESSTEESFQVPPQSEIKAIPEQEVEMKEEKEMSEVVPVVPVNAIPLQPPEILCSEDEIQTKVQNEIVSTISDKEVPVEEENKSSILETIPQDLCKNEIETAAPIESVETAIVNDSVPEVPVQKEPVVSFTDNEVAVKSEMNHDISKESAKDLNTELPVQNDIVKTEVVEDMDTSAVNETHFSEEPKVELQPVEFEEKCVEDGKVAVEELPSAPVAVSHLEEDISSKKIAPFPAPEVRSVSEVDQLKTEPALIAEEKPEETNDASDKSSNMNQLTFDYDASAPVPIVLPPSSKPEEAPAAKRRGRKRGRPLGGQEATDSGKENDSQPLILRQSSRIAKLREKEDDERRKAEADRLQRLKEEHERREKRRAARDERMKKMEEKQQRRQLKTTKAEVTYRDTEEESSSSSEDEGPKKRGRKGKRKRGKKKIDKPWDSTDSSEKSSESEEDGLEDLHVEEENEELVFKSDHEFSPESDLDEDAETAKPTKHARTARAGKTQKRKPRSKKVKIEEEVQEEEEVVSEEEEEEEEDKEANCHKCGQSDHPEWILLCDRCDCGWHANCVKPPLMVIPEGDWFCPPCDHAILLERLQERLEAYEFLLKEKEAELERKKEQEANLAKEEAEKKAMEEMEEEEAQDEDDEDEVNSGAGDLGVDAEDGEDEESEEDSGDEEDESEEESENDSEEETLAGRRQRKAAQQAKSYSFKEYDDMINSALRVEGEEEEEDEPGKGKGKGMRGDEEDDEEDQPARRSPSGRPCGIGNKRISTSDDDSDVMPRVIRKKKARKLNDLSASSNEDDSDEDFDGSSADATDSEEEDEEASESGDSFVVDDDSDDDDVIHVSAKRKAGKGRASSPTIRRSTRSARKRNVRMDSTDSSEEESEYEEVASKRRRGNESWDESGESSSDASWGRSKKRRSAPKGRAKAVAAPKPKPKPKPPPRKAPANRGRGRGGRANKIESDDEPFRSNVSVKKIKEARPAVKEDEDSDHTQRRTTRGRQINYKELIDSSGEDEDDGNPVKKMGTLFAADRGLQTAARGAASRRGGRGGSTVPAPPSSRSSQSGGDTTPVPISVISSRVGTAISQDDESRFSGSTDTLEFSTAAAAAAVAAASVYTTGDDSHTSNDILPPSIDPDLATLPIILPQDDEPSPIIKDDLPISVPLPSLSQDLQVSRLIQQRPAEAPTSGTLPADLQINRLINSSSSNSPARQSPGVLPLPQPRLVRDVLESQTPPPAVQLSPAAQTITPSVVDLPLYSHGGVIKQARHSLPPTPPLYSGPHIVKTGELTSPSSTPSVIRPYPTTATSSPSVSSTPGNPLSIQGLLGTGSSGPASSAPPPPHPGSHIRPYGNTPHMIGHGPFLNHTPYASPYSAVPSSRTSYMGTPVTPTPRAAYPPMYPSTHMPPHGLPPLHAPYQHHGPPLRPTSSYQHAGFPQAFAAAAAAAASAEEERRIYRVAAQASAEGFDPTSGAGLLLKGGLEDPLPGTAVPPESEFGGLVSYFSSQQEDFEES